MLCEEPPPVAVVLDDGPLAGTRFAWDHGRVPATVYAVAVPGVGWDIRHEQPPAGTTRVHAYTVDPARLPDAPTARYTYAGQQSVAVR